VADEPVRSDDVDRGEGGEQLTFFAWLNIACAGANGLLAGVMFMRARLMRQHLKSLPPIFNGMRALIDDYNGQRAALGKICDLATNGHEDCGTFRSRVQAIAAKALTGELS
jgi:uncharacterized protein YneF (UPF0154 family)